ncbi:MAG: tRNA pseudouridine(38-40) synthase TruA [Planctomycetota bacterium]
MSKCLITIAYDGNPFNGWQRQANRPSVQECMEEACAVIFGHPLLVEGAGRTDAGVHAFGQAAHVVLPRPFPAQRLIPALNGNLPEGIAIRSSIEVPDSFHARFHAVGKRYVFRCVVSRIRPAVGRGYFHWVRRSLDMAAMATAGQHLLGCHDFSAFATNPGYVRLRGTIRTIQHLHIAKRTWGFDLVIQGNGFLYNMVRIIAGTLIDVGLGKMQADRVPEILANRDRRQAGATAPACGLYLLRVLYPSDLSLPAFQVDAEEEEDTA